MLMHFFVLFYIHSISDKIRIILLYIIFKNGKNRISQGAFHAKISLNKISVIFQWQVKQKSDFLPKFVIINWQEFIFHLIFPPGISSWVALKSEIFQEISVLFAPFDFRKLWNFGWISQAPLEMLVACYSLCHHDSSIVCNTNALTNSSPGSFFMVLSHFMLREEERPWYRGRARQRAKNLANILPSE